MSHTFSQPSCSWVGSSNPAVAGLAISEDSNPAVAGLAISEDSNPATAGLESDLNIMLHCREHECYHVVDH